MKWLKRLLTPFKGYVVTKENPENGTEVRYNGHSMWLHINDQEKFNKYLKKRLKKIHLPKYK